MFLDQGGLSDVAFANLDPISGGDGGIGTNTVPTDPSVLLVSYAQVSSLPTANRLNALVNTAFAAPLVVTALNGGIDPFSGLVITGNGVTYVDNSPGFPVVRVVYDVGQCLGAGIAARDVLNQLISTPNPVVLYHELSHAFRVLNGTTQADDEIPARTDENVLRSQLGLCQRDVNSNVISCGAGNNCGGSTGGPGGTGPSCFIVSAATGSPQSAEVLRLRALRERIAAASGLAAQVIDAVYSEYGRFSPEMAATLESDEVLRRTVLSIVVRPLLAWYSLAGVLAFSRCDEDALDQARARLAEACRSPIGSRTIVWLLERLRDGAPLPTFISERGRDMAPGIRKAAQLPTVSWAILDPLVRAWRLSAEGLDEVEQVAQWLSQVPVSVLAPPAEPGRLEAELNALHDLLGFHSEMRARIGRGLATAWPEAEDSLSRSKFI